MKKNHILHCDGPHCPLKSHLIMPGQEATKVDGRILCEACNPVEKGFVQEYPPAK